MQLHKLSESSNFQFHELACEQFHDVAMKSMNIRVVHNNSGLSDQALLLTCSSWHVTGWFGTKNSALEAYQARGGCFTRGATSKGVGFGHLLLTLTWTPLIKSLRYLGLGLGWKN